MAGGFGWMSLVLLAHIWPALFPGQTLSLSLSGNSFTDRISLPSIPLPDQMKIETPKDSVFNRPIIILAVGTDTSADLENLRTDTILLARIDPVTKEVKLLSIPRDLVIQITHEDGRITEDRVNASFAIGAVKDHTVLSGMEQLAGDLQRNFAIKTDYWVQVDFRGAERIFDLIGGVDVVIPEDLSVYDWWYSDNDRPARTLSFPPGEQHLTGYEAVAFSRLREFDDDFHRIRRQQIVMEAAMSQAFSKGILNNIPSLWGAYNDAVTTNIDTSRVLGLGLLARETQGRLQTYSIADKWNDKQAVYDVTLPTGAEVLRGDPEVMQHWIDVALRDPLPTPTVPPPSPSTTVSGAATTPVARP